MSATDFVRKQMPHLTPMLVDGSIAVLTATLIYFTDGATILVQRSDDSWASWLLLLGKSGTVALTSLGAFRSNAYANWKNYRQKLSETEYIKSQIPK